MSGEKVPFPGKAIAEAAGYTVDTTVYPWFAYQGPRFGPTRWRYCMTDREAALAIAVNALILLVERDVALLRWVAESGSTEEEHRQRVLKNAHEARDAAWKTGRAR